MPRRKRKIIVDDPVEEPIKPKPFQTPLDKVEGNVRIDFGEEVITVNAPMGMEEFRGVLVGSVGGSVGNEGAPHFIINPVEQEVTVVANIEAREDHTYGTTLNIELRVEGRELTDIERLGVEKWLEDKIDTLEVEMERATRFHIDTTLEEVVEV